MNAAQRIVKNTASLLVSGTISALLHAVAMVYLARVLGPGNFGKISFALAIITYFSMIADPGLSMLGVRQVAREIDKIREHVSNILVLRLGLAVIGFGLLLLLAFLP